MNLRKIENVTQRLLAKSTIATWLAVKIRNQINCVVAYRLGETSDSLMNGEFNLLDCLAPRCQTFVDVGANVGNWTSYFLEKSKRPPKGYLFEPSHQCASRLKAQFSAYDIKVLSIALSDMVGNATFSEEADFGELSSLVMTAVKPTAARRYQVDISTLDAELLHTNVLIDFLKIDAEGYDLRVMKGARQLLLEKRVKFMQFEYNSYWLGAGSTLQDAFAYLNEVGFNVYLIRSTGIHEFDYPFWGDYFRYSNFFACRKEDISEIAPLLGKKI